MNKHTFFNLCLAYFTILLFACENKAVKLEEKTRELLPDPEKYKKDTFYSNDTTP